MTKKNWSADPLENLLRNYLVEFIAANRAAKVVADGLRVIGVGFTPIVDHLAFRTLNIDDRAKEFLDLGYSFCEQIGVLEYGSWFVKVFRKNGYPCIFLSQAYPDQRGAHNPIPGWVKIFSDQVLHHVAIRVEDIDNAVFFLEKQGVPVVGKISGEKGSDLRQVFTVPEIKDGKVYNVLELVERHRGNISFHPPEAPECFK